jgi:L-tryptophan--pyruvate aminotransferase
LGEAKEMVAWESGGMATLHYARRIGVVVFIAMNLAWLAMFIHRRHFGGGSRSDGNNSGNREVTTVEPSKGKLLVTSDSIVNLDQ